MENEALLCLLNLSFYTNLRLPSGSTFHDDMQRTNLVLLLSCRKVVSGHTRIIRRSLPVLQNSYKN